MISLEDALTGLIEAIHLDELPEAPEYCLLSWPGYEEGVAEARLEELRSLGVEALLPEGPMRRGDLRFLGKGHVGIVVKAVYRESVFALKIRRVDADRESMLREAMNQVKANEADVGPRLHGASDNFIVMEFIEGEYLPEWISKGDLTASMVHSVLKELLYKSRRLDSIGLDHGELGRPKRHVIVSEGMPRIIDFESASTERRPSNLTSIGQFLFINPRMREITGRHLNLPERELLIKTFREYKQRMSEKAYEELLRTLGLS
ncbi:MAG: serine/threonine protein kinase [Candidatus Bathyarchaeia archaeon]